MVPADRSPISPPVPCTYTVAEQRSPGNLIVGLRRSGQIAKINTSACGGGGGGSGGNRADSSELSRTERGVTRRKGIREEGERRVEKTNNQSLLVGTLSFFVFSLSLSLSLSIPLSLARSLGPILLSLSILACSLLFYGEWKY